MTVKELAMLENHARMLLRTKVRKLQERGQKNIMQHPKKRRTGKCPCHCQPHVEQFLVEAEARLQWIEE